jgi:polysaccharide biosynthesis protein PslH
MRVTVIDSDVAYPPTSGKRLRTLNLLMPLSKYHSITYIARSSDSRAEVSAKEFFSDHGIKTVFVKEPLSSKSGPSFYSRLAANTISKYPYSISSHMTPGMKREVAIHLRNCAQDLCQIEFLAYLYTLEGVDVPKVLQAHNVESVIWRRYAEVEQDWLKRQFIRGQCRKYLANEAQAFNQVSSVVTVSEADRQEAFRLYGDIAIDVVPNGVDLDAFGQVQRVRGSRQVIFLGSLDWRPNQDALNVLLDEIFPRLRQLVPDVSLVVVGRNPPSWISRKIATSERVSLCADVSDVRPFLGASAVMSVPLRIAGGTRLKILEAMASTLPVVSTTIGAEGLDVQDGVHLTIADSYEGQARALAEAIISPEVWTGKCASGYELVRARYGWSALSEKLDRIWRSAVAK